MQARIDESLIARRSPAILAGIFAAAALLLAAIGTYGVLAYAVSQRRREIGVRMALGALPQQILAQFLGLGARLLVVGLSLGVLGAWVAGRAMQSLLFGVGGLPVGLLAITAGVMLGVVFLAMFLPSRRAARVNPIDALRSE
jgi:ABC-type antimicrobial peptide transport system permease subunit